MSEFLKSHEIRLTNTRKLMKVVGLDRKDFAEKIGMTYNLFSQYIGRNPSKKIGDETAEKIEKAFDKPSGFLDQVNAFEDENQKPTKLNNFKMQEFIEQHSLNKADESSFDQDDIHSPTVVEYGTENGFIWIDVVEANFSCGTGEAIEFHFDVINGKFPFPPNFFKKKHVHPDCMKIIKAKGDSMSDFIHDEDLVGIDISQTEIIDGEIYAVYFEGEGMLKQIFKEEGGKLTLHSINSKYKDKEVTEQNGLSFRVMGRQFWRAG